MRISRSTVSGLETILTDGLTALIPQRDYSGLNQANSPLRVWLPEPAKQALEQACEVHDTSMTAYLTEYFAEYLYGHHELLRMKATRTGLYEAKPEVRYSKMTPTGVSVEPETPKLGKNIFALKIFIPEKIKAGLQQKAMLASASLGEFSRTLICGHLFGHDYDLTKLTLLRDEIQVYNWELEKE